MSEELNKKLIIAVRIGYLDGVQRLIVDGADPKTVNDNGDSVLLDAVEREHVEIVRTLHAAGASAYHRNSSSETPMLVAVDGKNVQIAEILFPGHTEEVDSEGRTPMMIAAKNGHAPMFDLVRDWPEGRKTDERGMTLLMWAAVGGNMDIVVDCKVSFGAILNQQDNAGRTALMYAAMEDRVEVVKYLLLEGADPNIKDNNGKNALSLAEEIGDELRGDFKGSRWRVIGILKLFRAGAKE